MPFGFVEDAILKFFGNWINNNLGSDKLIKLIKSVSVVLSEPDAGLESDLSGQSE